MHPGVFGDGESESEVRFEIFSQITPKMRVNILKFWFFQPNWTKNVHPGVFRDGESESEVCCENKTLRDRKHQHFTKIPSIEKGRNMNIEKDNTRKPKRVNKRSYFGCLSFQSDV